LSKHNGNAMTEMAEISARLNPENIDQACIRTAEVVKKTSEL